MTLNLDKTEWKHVALGEVAAASKEKVDPTDGSVDRYIAGEHMDSDDLKLHRWGVVGEVDLGPAFHRRFRPGAAVHPAAGPAAVGRLDGAPGAGGGPQHAATTASGADVRRWTGGQR